MSKEKYIAKTFSLDTLTETVTPELKLGGTKLTEGTHLVTIGDKADDVVGVLSHDSVMWAGNSRQVKFRVFNEQGYAYVYMNLDGFKSEKDYANGKAPVGFEFRSFDANSTKYCVNKKTNERVPSVENTEVLNAKFGHLAACIGLDDSDGDLSQAEIINAAKGVQIGIILRKKENGDIELGQWVPAENVPA